MPKTVVGLFENAARMDDTIREIEALGFPQNEVRTLGEPRTFGATGVMSFPEVEFEIDLERALTRIGATQAESEAYLEGLRHGGTLVFATGSDEKVDEAARVMNRHGAVNVEETSGMEPELPHVIHHEGMARVHESSVQTGRILQTGGGGGPRFFVW
jgi:hypothetical protein